MPVRSSKQGCPLLALLMLASMLAAAAGTAFAQQTPKAATPKTTTATPKTTTATPKTTTATPKTTNGSAQNGSAQNAPARQSGQSTAHAGSNAQFIYRTSVSEVVLYATVIDNHHHQVNNLTQQDFTVYENNTPQTTSSFRQEDVPVSLAILVDNSASMAGKRDAIDRAALDLVRASNPQDEAFIVNFSDEAILDQDFTSNIVLLEKGLSHIDSEGGTALYDAVIAAADHLSKHATRAKQVILIITDGEDNSSSATLSETVRRIQDLHGPIVYSIGLLYDEPYGRGRQARKALQTLSDETGGIAFFPKSLNQVDAITTEVARDIREQYILGYHPTQPISQGGYRAIRVEAKSKGLGKLTVRTRAGYFAQPPANSGTLQSSGPARP